MLGSMNLQRRQRLQSIIIRVDLSEQTISGPSCRPLGRLRWTCIGSGWDESESLSRQSGRRLVSAPSLVTATARDGIIILDLFLDANLPIKRVKEVLRLLEKLADKDRYR